MLFIGFKRQQKCLLLTGVRWDMLLDFLFPPYPFRVSYFSYKRRRLHHIPKKNKSKWLKSWNSTMNRCCTKLNYQRHCFFGRYLSRIFSHKDALGDTKDQRSKKRKRLRLLPDATMKHSKKDPALAYTQTLGRNLSKDRRNLNTCKWFSTRN